MAQGELSDFLRLILFHYGFPWLTLGKSSHCSIYPCWAVFSQLCKVILFDKRAPYKVTAWQLSICGSWNLKVTWGNLTSGPKNFSKSFFLHFSFIQGRLKGLLLYHLKRSHVFSVLPLVSNMYYTLCLPNKSFKRKKYAIISDYLYLSFFASFLKGRESKCFNFFPSY